MRLILNFRNEPDSEEVISTSFTFPDTAKTEEGKQRILEIGQLASKLTKACLSITCRDLGIHEHLIKRESSTTIPVRFGFVRFLLQFERLEHRLKAAKFLIAEPVTYPFPDWESFMYRGRKRKHAGQNYRMKPYAQLQRTTEHKEYVQTIIDLADHCLTLLNSEISLPYQKAWTLSGYHPFWKDQSAITKYEKLRKKKEAEAKAAERLKQRQAKLELKRSASLPSAEGPEPTTGAGRRPGAIPGVFKNVMMRSQLEIRFAAELEERNIRWIYEGERLGEQQYLVDFYLPDFSCWVEVKGKFEPRDNFQLPDVAAYLNRERQQKLYVYTQSRVYHFAANGRTMTMTHQEFWSRLGR